MTTVAGSSEPLTLALLPGTYGVHRLPPTAAVPDALWDSPLAAVLRSATELSIVCADPAPFTASHSEGPWRALYVTGTLDFSLTGILAGLTEALATAEISVFAVSSYDTDYLLVPAARIDGAMRALQDAGYLLETGH